MAQDDIYARMFDDAEREQARINIIQNRQPADVARARRLARVTGTAPGVIEPEPEVFEAQARRQQTDSVIQHDPELARWLGDPDNAALARDDLSRMSAVSQMLQPWSRAQQSEYLQSIGARGAPSFPGSRRSGLLDRTSLSMVGARTPRPDDRPINWSMERGIRGAGAMLGEAVLRTAQGAAGLERARAEILGDQFAAGAAREASGRIGGLIEAIHPDFRYGWQESAFSGLTSGTQMAMFAPAGATATLFGLSGTVSGEAYGRYRDRGGSIAQAATGGLLEGAIEYATERLPINWLLGRFGREGTRGFVAGFLLPEIVGEQVATTLQDAVDTAIANPDKTWAEYWAERPAAALDTAIATGVSLLGVGGAGAIMQRLQPQAQAADDITAAIAGQAMLDTLMSEAEQSQVRTLDPDSFSTFIAARTDGTPVQNVYIPVEAVRTYLQSDNAETEFFEPYAEQIAEAVRLNGDLVVPVGEVAARLAGTPAWEALREDARLTPGGMSGREAKERSRTFMQELEDRGAEIAQADVAESERQGSAEEVFQQVRQELLAAGRGEQEAEAIARIVAARREAAGERMGVSALEYHVANPIEFRQAARGEGVADIALTSTTETVDEGRTDSLSRTASWVLREKKTGKVVMETFDRAKVDALNTKKYEAVPIGEYLGSLNKPKGVEEAARSYIESLQTGGSWPQWQTAFVQGATGENRVFDPAEMSEQRAFKAGQIWAKEAPKSKTLNQDKARGQTQFYADHPGAVVTLFGTANFSTLIHELGHVFLEEMIRDGASANAPVELKEDVAKIRNWFAANKVPIRSKDKAKTKTFKQTNVATAAFKKWFGDSKVVDESGAPLVVYHGTNQAFDAFSTDKLGASTASPSSRLAMAFSSSSSVAGLYADLAAKTIIADEAQHEKRLAALQEKIKDAEIRRDWDVQEKLTEELEELEFSAIRAEPAGGNILSVYLSIKHPLLVDAKGGALPRGWPEKVQRAQADGHDGLILHNVRDDPTGAGGEVSTHYFVFRPEQIKSVNNRGTFEQNDPRILMQGGEEQQGDFEIPVEAHELFARGFERYTMEGKAPGVELRGVFKQFAAWLTNIYKTVRALRAPITPEIRGVMDRMLATETMIEQNQVMPGFANQKQARMTDAEWAAYEASIKGARDAAYDELLGKTMASIRRRETQRDREQRSNIRADVTAEVNARPEFVALHLLRTGRRLDAPDAERVDIKINTGWLIDNYGEDVLNQLPRGLPIIKGDGVEGDVVAEMTGMASGDQLVKTLISIRAATDDLRAQGEVRSVKAMLIESEVDRVMAARHGDVMTDGSIEEEAIAAINSSRQGEVLATELRQIRRLKPQAAGPTPYRIAREWARRVVAAGRVMDVASRAAVQRYIRATNKAAREFEKALLAEDYDEAFRQKQAQLLNHALLAESKIAADRVDAITVRMKRYAGRKAMGSVDQDYFDRVHELLERFDFRARSQKHIAEQDSFETWAARRQAEGFEVLVPPRLADRGEHYSRIDVDTLFELDDAVTSLMHLGRTKQKMKDAQGERAFGEWRDEAAAGLRQLPIRKLPERITQDERRIGAQFASPLLKIETIGRRFDGADQGPWTHLLDTRATEASIERDRLVERSTVPIFEFFKSLSPEMWRWLNAKVTSERLILKVAKEDDPRRGKPLTLTRMEWLGVALNMGNLSSKTILVEGERFDVHVLESEIMLILNRKEAWDMAQLLWDNVGLLYPDLARVQREMTGVVPEEIKPLEIETPFGPYQGGYWPAVPDIKRWTQAEKYAIDQADQLFGAGSVIGTPDSFIHERTGASYPMTYAIEEILTDHVQKVATRIAYAQWVRDVVHAIDNPTLSGLIDTRLGPEYRAQIKPWLKNQINANLIDRRGAAWWEKVLRYTRVGISTTAMGFAYSTGLAQTLGLTYSAGVIGPKYVALGMKKMLNPVSIGTSLTGASAGAFVAGPLGIIPGITVAMLATGKAGGYSAMEQFVFSRSPTMEKRGREVNREVVEVFRRLRGKAEWKTNAAAMAFWHIAMIDRYVVAMPTWLGAHQKGLDEGMTDEEAAAYADRVVVRSQGSGREKDLSAIQATHKEHWRFLTMFYTPDNVLFNAQWDAVRDAKSGKWRSAIMGSVWFMVVTVLADALRTGDWPDDDEGDGVGIDDLSAWFIRNVFFGLFGGVPLGRNGTNYVERDLMGQYATMETPSEAILRGAWRSARGTYAIAFEDEEVTSQYIRGLSTEAGALLHLPGGQIGKTGGFLWDVRTGDAQPRDIEDWYKGLTSGRLPAEE